MPAWLGLDFLNGFLTHTEGWESPDGKPLTHAVGLVFCNSKTPIRQARALAKSLADDAKLLGTPQNLVQIAAFESIALPDGDGALHTYRTRLLGRDYDDAERRAQTLSGCDWRHFFEGLLNVCGRGGEPFPRSQIHRLLQMAREGEPAEIEEKLHAALNNYFARVGRQGFDVSALKPGGRSLRQSLPLFSSLYDYAELLTVTDWPHFIQNPTQAVEGAA